jgi:hypothetical protein
VLAANRAKSDRPRPELVSCIACSGDFALERERVPLVYRLRAAVTARVRAAQAAQTQTEQSRKGSRPHRAPTMHLLPLVTCGSQPPAVGRSSLDHFRPRRASTRTIRTAPAWGMCGVAQSDRSGPRQPFCTLDAGHYDIDNETLSLRGESVAINNSQLVAG